MENSAKGQDFALIDIFTDQREPLLNTLKGTKEFLLRIPATLFIFALGPHNHVT